MDKEVMKRLKLYYPHYQRATTLIRLFNVCCLFLSLSAAIIKSKYHLQQPLWLFEHLRFISLVIFLLAAFNVLLSILFEWIAFYNCPLTSQPIAFLPEECVAELSILIKRMKKNNASPWEIRLRLMTELLYLFWALYIQIQIENLWLPSEDHEVDE